MSDKRLQEKTNMRRVAHITIKGDLQRTRGLVSRAIRLALGIRRWGEHPHAVSYTAVHTGAEPGYLLLVTQEELESIEAKLSTLAWQEMRRHAPVRIKTTDDRQSTTGAAVNGSSTP